jgi:hypothetical protein
MKMFVNFIRSLGVNAKGKIRTWEEPILMHFVPITTLLSDVPISAEISIKENVLTKSH